MKGLPDPVPWSALRRALAAFLLPLALGGPGAAGLGAEEAPERLPAPRLRRLPPRPVAGPVAPAPAAPAARSPGSAARSTGSAGALPAAAAAPLPEHPPRDPAGLPPPVVRRLPGRTRVLPGGAGAERAPAAPAEPVAPPGSRAAAGDGGLVQAPPRPVRPDHVEPPRPEDLRFRVERPGGVVKRFVDDGGASVHVMVGNPRVEGDAHRRADGSEVAALAIKARVLVVWIDEARLPDLSLAAPGPRDGAPAPERDLGSVFEEAVLGIYAEGAVELTYGAMAFRAETLYFEPRTYRGLMVEPRFEGRFLGKDLPPTGQPVVTRARRGRLVASGLMVFDDAEVATTRVDDRLALRVRSLTVEELGQAVEAELGAAPALLGFHALSTQRYTARSIQLRGERIPLAWFPKASFGLSQDQGPFKLKRIDAGTRANLGLYAFLGIGDTLGPDEQPWLEWILDVGGYTERGPVAGLTLSWDHPGRTRGEVQGWGVYFDAGTDRDGFDPDDDVRGRIVAESRSNLARDLLLDVEFNSFSDPGFNREYFERDDLTHKERESYVRLLYRPGSLAASLTGKWHQRDFVTETVEAPEAGLWLGSLPLLAPARTGGLGVDLTSVTRAGALGRRFDERLADVPYEAERVDHESRLEAGVSVGDLRLSGWAGVAAASYTGRTDGGEDLVRSALLAGVRADLQAHRVVAARGGLLQLDGLRHVLDVDASFEGRFLDGTDPADVPFFDEREWVEERSQATLRLRNRLQTRRPLPARAPGAKALPRSLRDVLDLETAFHVYVDDVAPWLERTPWGLSWSLRGEPREAARLLFGSEGDVTATEGLVAATASVGWQPIERLDVSAAYRWLKDEASAPLLQVSWRYSEKYSVRVTESYNFIDDTNLLRLVLRRTSDDHVLSFGLRLEDDGEVGFEVDFRPAIGGRGGDSRTLFANEVELDPTRTFR